MPLRGPQWTRGVVLDKSCMSAPGLDINTWRRPAPCLQYAYTPLIVFYDKPIRLSDAAYLGSQSLYINPNSWLLPITSICVFYTGERPRWKSTGHQVWAEWSTTSIVLPRLWRQGRTVPSKRKQNPFLSISNSTLKLNQVKNRRSLTLTHPR